VDTFETDTVVIGAGVVGLACARALALAGREVTVIEANAAVGQETSARNSEVVHAGIYYPTGSLKARACVEGRRLLYAFCDAHGVAFKRCGKLIVATDAAQTGELERLLAKGRENDVEDLEMLSGADAVRRQPALRAAAALLSPHSGIVDSHGFMLALLGEAEDHGAMLAVNAPVEDGAVGDGGIELAVGGAAPMRLIARTAVVSAGHGSAPLMRALGGGAAAHAPRTWTAKGNYFRLARGRPFTQLIYPVPEPGGLGVHVTIDLGGQHRFGPDVQWTDDPADLTVDPARADAFYARIRAYWPDLPDGALEADYAGMRPKLSGPGDPAADFRIDGPDVHGVDGLIALYGIESPGLTASMALAQRVAALAG
jgi:L-2-hydroxyglutarate oxidase LhgO